MTLTSPAPTGWSGSHRLRPGPPRPTGQRRPVAVLAAAHGLVYEDCCETDSIDGTGTGTYYTWWVRVSRPDHTRRGDDGTPPALNPVRAPLAEHLPPGLRWETAPDERRTTDLLATTALRTAYENLITPAETVLPPPHTDGAGAYEPIVRILWGGEPVVATYALLLGKDPGDDMGAWLYVNVGAWSEPVPIGSGGRNTCCGGGN